MSKYRIDFFKHNNETGRTEEHIKRYFDDLQSAVDSAAEGRRDGYITYLMEHVFEYHYNVMCRLV